MEKIAGVDEVPVGGLRSFTIGVRRYWSPMSMASFSLWIIVAAIWGVTSLRGSLREI